MADVIAAEDTRRTRGLLSRIGVEARVIAYHEHNEEQRVAELLEQLADGVSIALVSDAGTPLVSDPGCRLVAKLSRVASRWCRSRGRAPCRGVECGGPAYGSLRVRGVPAAAASARGARLEALRAESRTLVFFEAVTRLGEPSRHLADVFGIAREATLARELTKLYEEIAHGIVTARPSGCKPDREYPRRVRARRRRGRDAGAAARSRPGAVLRVLLGRVAAQAGRTLTARLTGLPRNASTQALALRDGGDEDGSGQ